MKNLKIDFKAVFLTVERKVAFFIGYNSAKKLTSDFVFCYIQSSLNYKKGKAKCLKN